MFHENFGWRRCLGLGLAFLGIALLAGEPRHASPYAFSLLVIGTIFWAWSNVLVKRMPDVKPFAIVGWMSLFAAPQLIVLSFIFESGQIDAVAAGGWELVATLAYTVIAASIVAHSMWYGLVQKYPLNAVVPFSMLIPIVGVSAGLLILEEPLTWQKAAGGTLPLAGVAVIQLRLAAQTLVKRTIHGE